MWSHPIASWHWCIGYGVWLSGRPCQIRVARSTRKRKAEICSTTRLRSTDRFGFILDHDVHTLQKLTIACYVDVLCYATVCHERQTRDLWRSTSERVVGSLVRNARVQKLDEDSFQTAYHLVGYGHIMALLYEDCVATVLCRRQDGNSWLMNPFEPTKNQSGELVHRGRWVQRTVSLCTWQSRTTYSVDRGRVQADLRGVWQEPQTGRCQGFTLEVSASARQRFWALTGRHYLNAPTATSPWHFWHCNNHAGTYGAPSSHASVAIGPERCVP